MAALDFAKNREVEFGAAFALALAGDSQQAQAVADDLERTSTADAQEHARTIVADAQDRVHRMVAEAEERTAAIVAESEDRLAAIRTERDAVAGYLENLRGVLTHATGLLDAPAVTGLPAGTDEDEDTAAR